MATITTAVYLEDAARTAGEAMTGIYCIRHRLSGKRYIGQSTNIKRRFAVHCGQSRKGASAIADAILAFGASEFEFFVVEVCSRDLLNERETYWIAEFGSMVPTGYNLNSGGKAPTSIAIETREKMAIAKRGTKRSASTRAKHSRTFKERVNTPEWRQKLSVARRRYVQSQETIQKRAAAQVGKVVTLEQRINVARAHMRGRSIGCSNGERYLSTKEAAMACGLHTDSVLRVCNGKYQQAKGFVFWYEDAA